MKQLLHRHRRLFSAGILLAFMAAWVLPGQAGAMGSAAAATHASCPDCPSSCAGQDCCATMTACAAMLPTAAASASSLDKAAIISIVQAGYPVQVLTTAPVAAPAGPPPRYSPPSALNIRFCTFQE